MNKATNLFGKVIMYYLMPLAAVGIIALLVFPPGNDEADRGMTVDVDSESYLPTVMSDVVDTETGCRQFTPLEPLSATSGNMRFRGHVGGHTNVVSVDGDIAYVGEGARLTILDISDPERPAVIGKSDTLLERTCPRHCL